MAIKLLAAISNLASVGKDFLGGNRTEIGDLIIDATYSSNIKYSNTITDNPVERSGDFSTGSYVSDNIYNNPITLDLQCAILDSPVGVIATTASVIDIFSGNIVANLVDRYKGKGRNQIAAYKILRDMWEQGTIFTVVSYTDVIDNLVIESLDFPRDGQTGDRLLFTISLKRLEFAESLTTAVSIPIVSSSINDLVSGRLNLGGQVTSSPAVGEVASTSSLLKRMKDGVTSSVSGFF